MAESKDESNHDGTPIVLDEYETEGHRLSEQFRNLQANRMVLDWWQKQLTEIRYGYEGVSHTLNKAVADSVKTRQDLLREIQELKDRCKQLEAERFEANASMGQLQRDLLAVSERLEGFAKWAGDVKRKLEKIESK